MTQCRRENEKGGRWGLAGGGRRGQLPPDGRWALEAATPAPPVRGWPVSGAPTHPLGLGSWLWGSLSGGGDVTAAVPLEEVGLAGRVRASSARLQFPKGGLPVGGQVGPGRQGPARAGASLGLACFSAEMWPPGKGLCCRTRGALGEASHALPRCRRPAQGREQPRLLPGAGPWHWHSWPGPCGRDSHVTAGPRTRCVQAAPSVDAGLEGVTRRALRPRQRLRPAGMPLLSGRCDRMVRTGEQSLPGAPAGGRPHAGHL